MKYLEYSSPLLSFSGGESLPSPHNRQVSPVSRLPWSITVHFSEFPTEILLECPSRCPSSNSLLTNKHIFPLHSGNNFLQGGGGVNIYVLSEGVRPVENKWKGVDCETLLRIQQKPGDEADAGKRTQPTLVRALQVSQDFLNDQ